MALHVRAVLVLVAVDFQLALGQHEPAPAAAELRRGGRAQLGLKLVEAAESVVDGLGQFAGRLAAALGPHDAPEHRMIGMAAAVVDDGLADVLGYRLDSPQNVRYVLLG